MRKGNIVRNVSFECFFFFFVRVWYQNAKKHGKHSKWENKTQPETCILSVFELHTYQTAKMHEKETTIFPKKLVFWDFWVRYVQKTPKYMQSTLYGKTKINYEKSVLWVFLSFLGTKTLKRMNSTLYGETKQDYQKRVFWVYSRW